MTALFFANILSLSSIFSLSACTLFVVIVVRPRPNLTSFNLWSFRFLQLLRAIRSCVLLHGLLNILLWSATPSDAAYSFCVHSKRLFWIIFLSGPCAELRKAQLFERKSVFASYLILSALSILTRCFPCAPAWVSSRNLKEFFKVVCSQTAFRPLLWILIFFSTETIKNGVHAIELGNIKHDI